MVVGGSFYIAYDAVSLKDETHAATVSDFRLDRFEATVGRFRKFVTAWNAGWRPTAGDGKHTHLNGGQGLTDSSGSSTYESGWDLSFASSVAPTDANLQCNTTYQTWTPTVGSGETRPIVCENWFEAAAFCIWDGGFLPSEAEWNYAASGGSEQRVYPWSSPPTATTIDCAHANYYNASAGSYCVSTFENAVGSESPTGDGKFKQADLAGNAWEWNLDWFNIDLVSNSDSSANLRLSSARVLRGGGYNYDASTLLAGFRDKSPPSNRAHGIGFRCARPPLE
jgi:formylglycine-generating enzyme required for sulfatase activity